MNNFPLSLSQFPAGAFSAALLLYVFFAFCLQRISVNCGEKTRSWWAWVPIVQVLLMLELARLRWWFIFLLLIPLVNLVLGIIIWIKIAQRLGRSPIWGVLMFVPVLDLAVIAYLAFSKAVAPQA